MVKTVVITKFGECKEKKCQMLKVEDLWKKCGFSNSNDFGKEATWSFEGKWISLYAKTAGRHNHINKYDFPPPCDSAECMYYGTAIICKHENEEPNDEEILNITKDEWEKFYERAFGGFESLGEEEEDSEDELENVPKEMKTKDGYLKDGFVVDTSSNDDNYNPSSCDESQSGEESDLNSEDELSEESYLSDDE
tara:strand:+ start:3099 stop:3680 length:582 start_codon:yes stop_codon:yes gene_type:complete